MKLVDALVVYDLLPATTSLLAQHIAQTAGQMGPTEFNRWLENNLPFATHFDELFESVRNSHYAGGLDRLFNIDRNHSSTVHGVVVPDLLFYINRMAWSIDWPATDRPDLFVSHRLRLTAARLRFDRPDPVAHISKVITHARGGT